MTITSCTQRVPSATALLLVVVSEAAFATGSTAAQKNVPSTSSDAGSAEVIEADEPASGSPRAAVADFLERARAGELTAAARYLDVPSDQTHRAPELARRLKAVLDRHAWIDLDAISPLASGDADDGLSPRIDEIAVVPDARGRPEPVRIERTQRGAIAWQFSRATVAHVDDWYGRLEHRFLREHLPEPLLRPGPKELLWWQWLALPLIVTAAWLVGSLLSRLTRRMLARATSRTAMTWDEALLERLRGPFTFGYALLLTYVSVQWLGLYEPAEDFLTAALRGGAFVAFFWALSRCVDVVAQVVITSSWGQLHAGSRSLFALAARAGKLAVLAMAVVALLSQLGYPVASLVAGLGIGGLALALAAQKSVENLFGAFSIAADQPFREGDFVKIEDFVGTIEVIGLRSTKIRTLDRTLITVPNGKLAEMRLESFTARDRIRLSCVLGVVYETSGEQMKRILEGFERVLRQHSKIWPDAVVVRFREFGASSLDIEVMAWFETSDYGEFQQYRQEVLLEFMQVVEDAGSAFAFPTQTVHVAAPAQAAAGERHDARRASPG
jgi:MscS family membrane protein